MPDPAVAVADEPGATMTFVVDGAPALAIGPADVPLRKVVVAAGPDRQAPDYGRLLIEFQDRARGFAEAGDKLKANREKYAELLSQLKALDEEYDAVSRLISESQEGYQLLDRLAKVRGIIPPPA